MCLLSSFNTHLLMAAHFIYAPTHLAPSHSSLFLNKFHRPSFWYHFSLVDLTWTHSFKYSSYAEDSQIYYLHYSIWLKAWICLDSNHGWSIPLWPRTSYLISMCLRYPVREIRDHTISYYLLVLLWGLNELAYVKCLEYCLHIYNCWLYYCNSRPDFLPEPQAYISSRLLGILTSMSNRHLKWIIPKPNLWSLPKLHTTLPLVFFISANSISIFPFT